MARPLHPEIATERGRVAGLVRMGANPDTVEAARGVLAAVKRRVEVDRRIEELLALAPLTDEQRARLSALLASADGGE